MYRSRHQGPPAWFVFIVGVAIVFGAFRLWIGVQQFFKNSGAVAPNDVAEPTLEDAVNTSNQPIATSPLSTRYPTMTPIPTCQEFIVSAGAGKVNVRLQPTTLAEVLGTFAEGDRVCVLERQGDWYLVDRDTNTRRIEEGYVFNNLLEASNPSPTPMNTLLPPPTITLTFTVTPTKTPTPTRAP